MSAYTAILTGSQQLYFLYKGKIKVSSLENNNKKIMGLECWISDIFRLKRLDRIDYLF